MRGCIDCKHHKSELVFEPKIDTIKSCTIGNDMVCMKWWVDHAHVKSDSKDFIVPDCAQMTDHAKILQGMIDKSKEILQILKNR